MSKNRKFRRIVTVAAALVVGAPTVALAVPADLGAHVSAAQNTTAVTATVDLRSPDARDAASGVPASSGATINLSSPDTRDAVAGKDVGLVVAPPAPQVVATHSDGFDWGDAGIGGAIMLVLVLTGGIVLLTHRRHGSTGSSALAS